MQKFGRQMFNRAIIAGASGLTGSELLDILLNSGQYNEVLVLVRKKLPADHPKLRQLVVNFDKPESFSEAITGHALFCCLGTTRKKTPDLSVYRKIDHDYPLQLAQLCKQNGVEQYHLVSALGANKDASNFYLKMKGETERDIAGTGLPALCIYQPSFLTGKRAENRPVERFLEPVMKVIDVLLIGGLKKYRSIAAGTVARAMYNQSLKNLSGVHIYPSDIIKELA